MATAYSEQVDVTLLQETHVKLGHTPKVRGYSVFSEPEIPQQSRGYMILVKNDIPCAKIEELILCGEGVETQAVKLYLADTTLVCYNVYKRHAGVLDISELMSKAANNKVFIGGDFNAHRATERESTSYKHLMKCQESDSSIMESPPIGMEED